MYVSLVKEMLYHDVSMLFEHIGGVRTTEILEEERERIFTHMT